MQDRHCQGVQRVANQMAYSVIYRDLCGVAHNIYAKEYTEVLII